METHLARPHKTALELLPRMLADASHWLSYEMRALPGRGIYREHVAALCMAFVAVASRAMAVPLGVPATANWLRQIADHLERHGATDLETLIKREPADG